jgi:hypothetical protein
MTAYRSAMEKAIAPFSEKRSLTRTTCCIPVDYCVSDRVYRDFIHNVSPSGAYIESRQALEVGTQMQLTFPWIDRDRPIKSKGIVVRIDPQGFGLKFSPPIQLFQSAVS